MNNIPVTRYRGPKDDRHTIRNPQESQRDCQVFAATLTEKRIAELYKTIVGLPGHVQQVNQQLRRLTVPDDAPPELISTMDFEARRIRASIIKARDAASREGMDLSDVDMKIEIPFLHDSIPLSPKKRH